jgi:DNA-binding response OmpR family regulator
MPFDIVITDLAMPDVDGRQVVGGLRALSPTTPIVLLTGWQFQVTRDEQRALKVDRLLGKPPSIRELRAALAELTGRRASDRPA